LLIKAETLVQIVIEVYKWEKSARQSGKMGKNPHINIENV